MRKLVDIVIDDADRASRLEEDRATAEARRTLLDAEDRLAEMVAAAKALGRTRGEAADRALALESTREVERIHATAADELFARFSRHVLLALDALPEADAYAEALDTWARQTADVADGPLEVFSAKRDREAVYEALLRAGVKDFQVKVLRNHTVGFVVRDLDGRTVLDRRPTALVEAHADALREILTTCVPPFVVPDEAEPEASAEPPSAE